MEPAAAPLRAVPLALLLVINRIPASLAAYGEDPAVLHLHLHVPLSDPREVDLEDMRLRGLLPVHADVVCAGVIRGKATECIEDVAVTTQQHIVDERHIRCCCCFCFFKLRYVANSVVQREGGSVFIVGDSKSFIWKCLIGCFQRGISIPLINETLVLRAFREASTPFFSCPCSFGGTT